MGFITKQWLTAYPERNHGHGTVEVKLTGHSYAEVHTLPAERAVHYGIRADTPAKKYQTIEFTKPELNKLLPSFAQGADLGVLEELALTTLLRLDDRKLVKFLEELFTRRVQEKSNRASKESG